MMERRGRGVGGVNEGEERVGKVRGEGEQRGMTMIQERRGKLQ